MYIHVKIIKENTWPGIVSTMDRPTGTSNKRKKSKNFTKQELEVLVDSVYEHKTILTSKFKSNITNEDKNRLWDQITNKVNSVSEVARTREAVKKKWQDFSSLTKGKEAKRRSAIRLTGGGVGPDELSTLEVKTVEIIGDIAIDGLPRGVDTSRLSNLGSNSAATLDVDSCDDTSLVSQDEDETQIG